MISRIDGSGTAQQVSLQMDKSTTVDTEVMVREFQKMAEKAVQKAADGHQLPSDEAKKLTDSMNKFLKGSNTELRFEFHEKLHEYYVTIVDPKTKQVVKEIPSKKLLDAHAMMRELNGLFVNTKI